MGKKQWKNSKKPDLCQQITSKTSYKNDILEAALAYEECGYSVIPLIEKDKLPAIKSWKRFQKKAASKEQIRNWLETNPNANLGIVCGKVSGIVVLDVDSKKASKFIKKNGFKRTPVVETARGRHIYFRHPAGVFRNKVDGQLGLDIRADGGYVVAPPSIHPNGQEYKWILAPWDQSLADLPSWVKELSKEKPAAKIKDNDNPKGWVELALAGVKKGKRNQTCAELAGHYISKKLSDSEIASLLLMWNKKNREPLPTQEIHRTIASIRATHNRKNIDPTIFPDVMSGLAGDFAELYSRHLESPPQFFYLSFLTALGVTLARQISLNIEISPPPRLFTVLLGESADERKSTAIKKVVEFFEAVARDDNIDMIMAGGGFRVCWGVGSAEGLQKSLSKSPQLLLCLDEFKQFVGKCGIKGSVLLPCVNSLFEDNHYENHTKNSRIILDNANLSLLAASTTDTWDQIWSSAFTAIGFNNRLFLVPGKGKRKYAFPFKVPEDDKNNLAHRLKNLILKFDCRKELEISETGRKRFEEWYLDIQSCIHSKRLDAYALRLMPLLAANDEKDEVDEEIVEKAIALCDWQLDVRKLHDPIDAENKMAQMEERIRRLLRSGPMTEREIKQRTNYTRVGIWFYEKAMENLRRNREIKKIGPKGRGVRWELIS